MLLEGVGYLFVRRQLAGERAHANAVRVSGLHHLRRVDELKRWPALAASRNACDVLLRHRLTLRDKPRVLLLLGLSLVLRGELRLHVGELLLEAAKLLCAGVVAELRFRDALVKVAEVLSEELLKRGGGVLASGLDKAVESVGLREAISVELAVSLDRAPL